MVDLLFGDVQWGQRRTRTFRLSQNSIIDEYTDDELRACYRFGRESILFITDLLACDIRRDTWRTHALQPLTQVLVALRFYASGSFLQVVADTIRLPFSGGSEGLSSVGCEAKSLHKVALHEYNYLWSRGYVFFAYPLVSMGLVHLGEAFELTYSKIYNSGMQFISSHHCQRSWFSRS